MKKIFNYILALGMSSGIFTACVDDINVGNAFLEKAPGVDVNVDTVFSKAEYVRNFLWSAYGQLYCTYTAGNMMNGAPIDVLSDSYHCYCGWGEISRVNSHIQQRLAVWIAMLVDVCPFMRQSVSAGRLLRTLAMYPTWMKRRRVVFAVRLIRLWLAVILTPSVILEVCVL